MTRLEEEYFGPLQAAVDVVCSKEDTLMIMTKWYHGLHSVIDFRPQRWEECAFHGSVVDIRSC